MKHLYMIVALFVCLSMESHAQQAQTPVENLIAKYEDCDGVQKFFAQGVKMSFARTLIKRTPVAPIADDVTELAVLKMQNAPEDTIKQFSEELAAALKHYEYYGRHSTKNGLVDIYVLSSGSRIVEELVIYNPEIYSLNSLRGSIPVDELLKLE